MTVHVRWPAKNSGAFVFGLNFWFKPKEKKKIHIYLSNDLNLLYFLGLESLKDCEPDIAGSTETVLKGQVYS